MPAKLAVFKNFLEKVFNFRSILWCGVIKVRVLGEFERGEREFWIIWVKEREGNEKIRIKYLKIKKIIGFIHFLYEI